MMISTADQPSSLLHAIVVDAREPLHKSFIPNPDNMVILTLAEVAFFKRLCRRLLEGRETIELEPDLRVQLAALNAARP